MFNSTRAVKEIKVIVNRYYLKDFIKSHNLNIYSFSRLVGLDPSQLHRFLKTGIGGGRVLWGKIYYFCKQNGLNFDDFIQIKEAWHGEGI